jgi:hypothetical protein
MDASCVSSRAASLKSPPSCRVPGLTDVRGAWGEGGEAKWKRPWLVRSTRGTRRRNARWGESAAIIPARSKTRQDLLLIWFRICASWCWDRSIWDGHMFSFYLLGAQCLAQVILLSITCTCDAESIRGEEIRILSPPDPYKQRTKPGNFCEHFICSTTKNCWHSCCLSYLILASLVCTCCPCVCSITISLE